jgi:hypothetical protein
MIPSAVYPYALVGGVPDTAIVYACSSLPFAIAAAAVVGLTVALVLVAVAPRRRVSRPPRLRLVGGSALVANR